MLLPSSFPHAQEIFRKLFAIWVCARKNIRQSCPKLRKLEEYRFQGAPNYQSARDAPYVSGLLIEKVIVTSFVEIFPLPFGNRNLFILFQNKVVVVAGHSGGAV